MDRVNERNSGDESRPSQHIDQVVSPEDNESRDVEICRTDDWGAIGLPLFLSAEELEKQGINTETTEDVKVRVQNGFLLIDSK